MPRSFATSAFNHTTPVSHIPTWRPSTPGCLHLQMLLADPVLLTAPRTGPKACLRVGSAMPRGYKPADAKAAVFSNDCSAVPADRKVWRATEQSAGWWQFSTTDGATCLTIVKADVIPDWYSCECWRQPCLPCPAPLASPRPDVLIAL